MNVANVVTYNKTLYHILFMENDFRLFWSKENWPELKKNPTDAEGNVIEAERKWSMPLPGPWRHGSVKATESREFSTLFNSLNRVFRWIRVASDFWRCLSCFNHNLPGLLEELCDREEEVPRMWVQWWAGGSWKILRVFFFFFLIRF